MAAITAVDDGQKYSWVFAFRIFKNHGVDRNYSFGGEPVAISRHAATPKYHVWSLPKFGSWNLSRSWDNKDYWEFLTPSTADYLLATLQISSGGSNCTRRKEGLAVSFRCFKRRISISISTPGHRSIKPGGGGSWASNAFWKRRKPTCVTSTLVHF